jgi:hypothetical protein
VGGQAETQHNVTSIMIEKKSLQKLLQSITRRRQGFSDHNLMHPEREWLSGLISGIVILGVGVVWCVNLYINFNDIETINQVSAAPDQTIYRTSDVERALSELNDRNQIYENLKQTLQNNRVILPTTPFIETEEPLLPALENTPEETRPTEDPQTEPALPPEETPVLPIAQ